MSIPSPSFDLIKESSTSFIVRTSFPQNYTVDVYIKSSDSFTEQYLYYGSLLQSGDLRVSNRPAFGFQQVYAVCKDAQNNISLPFFSSLDLNNPDSILSAVKSKWYSTPSLMSKFTGGMFANEAPESIEGKTLSMPYVIVRDSDRNFNFTTESTYFEGTNLDFIIYAPGAALVDECLEIIRESFDWKPLPFVKLTNKTVSMQPIEQNVRSENFRYKDGNLIFRGSVIYDIMITRVL
jgi:hypothetical protein